MCKIWAESELSDELIHGMQAQKAVQPLVEMPTPSPPVQHGRFDPKTDAPAI